MQGAMANPNVKPSIGQGFFSKQNAQMTVTLKNKII